MNDRASKNISQSPLTSSGYKRRRTNQHRSKTEQPIEASQTDTNDSKDEEKEQSPMAIFGGKDPFSFSIKELQQLCNSKEISAVGNKTELIVRLLTPPSLNDSNLGNGSITESQVHSMLRNAGVNDPVGVNPCLKAGILKGHYRIDGAECLDQILLEGRCEGCGKDLEVTIRDTLYQSCYGGDYEDGAAGGAVHCGDEECGKQYITRLCEGEPYFDCGKFHHHCTECPKFGVCLGDYRESHCRKCGGHWFAGLSGFPCEHCGDGASDYEDEFGHEFSDVTGAKERALAMLQLLGGQF